MSLPIFQGGEQPLMLLQTSWASILNPLIKDFNSTTTSSGSSGSFSQEYVFNTNITTNLGAGQTDTTSFGSGIGGVRFGSFDSATAGSTTERRVRFSTPIAASDYISLEYSQDGGSTWTNQSYISFQRQGSWFYGFYIFTTVGTTDLNIEFGNGGATPSNAGYGAAGQAWSVYSGDPGSFWRVRKISFA